MANNLTRFRLKNIKRLIIPRDIIEFSVEKNSNKIAIRDENKNLTYSKLYSRSKKLANGLLSLGLKKGDKLCIILKNSSESFETRIACYLAGIILVPLIIDIEKEDLIEILNDLNINTIIYHQEVLEGMIESIQSNTNSKNLIFANNSDISPYEQLIKNNTSNLQKIKLNPNDIASINFSSGSTGKPKGVILTYKAWMESFYCFSHFFKKGESGKKTEIDSIKIIHALSFSTAGGGTFLPMIYMGIENIVLKNFNIEKFCNLLIKTQAKYLFLSPSYLYEIMDYLKSKNIKLKLNRIIIGTEPISQKKFKEAIEYFGPILTVSYGMVEVLPPLTKNCYQSYINGDEINLEVLKTVGNLIPGVEIKLIDFPGSLKKIAIKSPTISEGYYNNPELTQEHFRNRAFLTNDYGNLTKEGYLEVLGREEDIIEQNGESYFRKDIEELFYKNNKISRALIIQLNKKIYCLLAIKRGEIIKPSELDELYKNEIKPYIKIDKTIITKSIPLNFSGKVDFKKIKRKLNPDI